MPFLMDIYMIWEDLEGYYIDMIYYMMWDREWDMYIWEMMIVILIWIFI
jgi:hypothetical protein